jgi:hypothetical protein
MISHAFESRIRAVRLFDKKPEFAERIVDGERMLFEPEIDPRLRY